MRQSLSSKLSYPTIKKKQFKTSSIQNRFGIPQTRDQFVVLKYDMDISYTSLNNVDTFHYNCHKKRVNYCMLMTILLS